MHPFFICLIIGRINWLYWLGSCQVGCFPARTNYFRKGYHDYFSLMQDFRWDKTILLTRILISKQAAHICHNGKFGTYIYIYIYNKNNAKAALVRNMILMLYFSDVNQKSKVWHSDLSAAMPTPCPRHAHAMPTPCPGSRPWLSSEKWSIKIIYIYLYKYIYM